MGFEKLYYYRTPEKNENPVMHTADIIIYGATSSGLAAAVQARRLGLTVIIAEFGEHFGGMTASGLGATDVGAKEAVGGIAREFYDEVNEYYGEGISTSFEPKVAHDIFSKWIDEYEIEMNFLQHLDKVEKEDGKISLIIMEDGTSYKGKVFLDCTYEGDLLARAGISYHIGREANSTYKEIYNGIQFGGQHHKFETWIDPYVIEGEPTSGVVQGITETDPSKIGFNGQSDEAIQAYNFRVCLTKDETNKIPIPKPPNYDPERYILLQRYIKAGYWDAMNLHTMLPNGKSDLNNYGGFSSDNIGANYEWPEGDYLTREKIFQDHVTYNIGMLYFLANDSRIPKDIRDEVSAWGLPKDEFVQTNHWPHQLYIREARRMISDYVMTDRNCVGDTTIDDSVALASYQMDSHHCRRVILDGRVVNEGDIQIPISPYPISYRSIRPKLEECTNLLVPVCVSSSHIAYGSIRMEPVFMILGQSAAVAAYLAIENKQNVQDIPYKQLKNKLVEVGQVVDWDDSIEYDPIKEMRKTLGKETIKRK